MRSIKSLQVKMQLSTLTKTREEPTREESS